MAFKLNISTKDGKTYHTELESEELIGKELKNKVEGKDIGTDFNGYEFEITGASDLAGFPSLDSVEGIALKRVLLKYGKGLHKRPKGLKKKTSKLKPEGLRMRKTIRGKVISPANVQINLKVLKSGHKSLSDIFPEQNKKVEKKAEKEESKKENSENK